MDHHSSLRQWALILLNVMPIPISNLFLGAKLEITAILMYWIYTDLYILVTADVTDLNKQLVLISRHMCCPFYFTLCWPLEWLVFHKSSLLLMCFYSAFTEKESTLIVHSDCIWWMNCLLMWYALHNKRSNIGCLVNDPNVLNNAVPLF